MIASDTDLSLEWEARLPGLGRLWAITTGLPQVRVAVLDGPVEPAAAPVGLITPNSVAEHGTLVASILGGSRTVPKLGLAPGCTVLSIPIFEQASSGELKLCSQEALAEAIAEAVSAGAWIINISASQQTDLLSLSPVLSRALQEALAADILIVAAAGNGGCACDVVPASCHGVLAVGAHDQTGRPLPGSNWGPGQRAGILAPGFALPGACLKGGVCRGTGTSFAAAAVSGVAALLMSLEVQAARPISGQAIRKLLIDTTDTCPRDEVELCGPYLSGRLNVSRALDRLLKASAGEAISIRTKPKHEGSEMTGAGIETERSGAIAGVEAVTRPSVSDSLSEGLGPAHEDCACGGKCNGDCGCGGAKAPSVAAVNSQKLQLVYAIGRLGISFPSQVRRDGIWRKLNPVKPLEPGTPISREIDLKPIDGASLQTLFDQEPWQAQAVYWTLSRTEVPMYAIVPGNAFAAETYKWLAEEWADNDVELISLAGVIVGQVTLYDGMTVDAVMPDLRGLHSWETKRYVDALTESLPQPPKGATADDRRVRIERFLRKIYFSIRNRGLAPEERALNAAATNAFNLTSVILDAGSRGLALKDITVERSPLNRPGSEYYDVLLTFFKPDERLNVSPLVARFTIDVSDTVPVVVGEPVSWYEF